MLSIGADCLVFTHPSSTCHPMLSKSSSWFANALVSVATVATVLVATGRSNKAAYAVLFQLGSSSYDYLCQINPIRVDPVPTDPGTGGNDGPGFDDGGVSGHVLVPEPSGVGGLVILAGLWAGVALVQRSAQRRKAKSALPPERQEDA